MMRVFVAIEIENDEIIDAIKKFQDEIIIVAKPVESKNFILLYNLLVKFQRK